MDLFEPARQAHHWASKRAERYYLGELRFGRFLNSTTTFVGLEIPLAVRSPRSSLAIVSLTSGPISLADVAKNTAG